MEMQDALSRSQWIWSSENPLDGINQYAQLRVRFAAKAAPARIWLSADWDFVLWLNGLEVGRGQHPDYPERRFVTCYDVPELIDGENTLAVLVYAPGANFSTQMAGTPGLLASVEQDGQVICATEPGGSWKARRAPQFQDGEMPHVTQELGFTMAYDARLEDSFEAYDYDDSLWASAIASPRKCTLAMRPLKPLANGRRLPAIPCARGLLRRDSEGKSFALSVRDDIYDCDPKEANGRWMTWDLGSESTGHARVELYAAKGTVVDLSWGEYLKDRRVVNWIAGRNYTMRLICQDGHNCFHIPFLRLGARYVQLNITGPCATKTLVRYAGMDDFSVELPPPAAFDAPIPHQAALREIAMRTLKCCMHYHYEDCCWREQSLYGYDSRNQMLYGYYAWGNYAFARASLELLGYLFDAPTGEISLCAPNAWGEPIPSAAVIPSFTRAWIAANAEYALYSGDLTLAQQLLPTFRQALKAYQRNFDEATGLYAIPEEPGIWNFFEWCDPELFRTGAITVASKGWHHLHNLYTLEAIQSCARLFRMTGNDAEAAAWETKGLRLGEAINTMFWNPEKGLYATSRKDGDFYPTYHQHSQFLPLALGIVPEERVIPLCRKLKEDTALVASTFSPLPYLLRGLFRGDNASRLYAAHILETLFMPMLKAGATTFWETPKGPADFGNAGSLCHGWSSVHLQFFGECILGVRPLEPGFRTFLVKPWSGLCDHAEGEVPTPHGMIRVRWEKQPDGHLDINVTAPDGCQPVIEEWQ